jgi:hypothetical protein
MRIPKKAVVILVPSLLFGLGGPAWSASPDQAAPINAQVMPASPAGNSLLDMLSPILTNTDSSPRQPKQNCKAPQMYSQHDIVGDPESCFMGRLSIGSGSNFVAPVSVP